jgi:hypothetical protein
MLALGLRAWAPRVAHSHAHRLSLRPTVRRATIPRASPRLAVEETLELSVYIEETDCYNVVYYANYFKWFQRGLQVGKPR